MILHDFRPLRLRVTVPLVSVQVCAGFPSPADDHLEEGEIDWNELLMPHPASTFVVRAQGESMAGEHNSPRIADGDLLVVDRTAEAKDGSIVVACLDGGVTVKRLRKAKGRVWLAPENKAFPEIEIQADQELIIWGVVTGRVSQFR